MYRNKIKQFKRLCDIAKKNNRSFISIIKEYNFYRKTRCLFFNEYLDYEFEKQSDDFKKSFLGVAEEGVYLEYLNPFKYYILARNKYLSHVALEHAMVPMPQLYCMYNPESGRESDLRISYDLASTLNILKSVNTKEFVIKAPEGSHGESVFAVRNIIFNDSDAVLETVNGENITLSSLVQKGYPLLFEEKILQTKQISDFNPSSVNTIRFMTTLMPSGEAKIIAAFIKIGRTGAFVDNAGSGGNVDAGINIETGEIYGAIAFNGFRNCTDINVHPDTKVQLNGVVINNWSEICKEVCKFQQRFPFLKAVGWDIAITDSGPVVIEINDFWDRTGQLFIKRGWREGIRECCLAWLKYNDGMNVNYNMGRINPASSDLKAKFLK